MRVNEPRIPPVDDEEADEVQARALDGLVGRDGEVLNIFRTLVRAPEALAAFLTWGSYVLSRENTLSPRDRELVVLRTGWRCRSGYEWAQHVEIARRAGVDDAEIERVKLGGGAPGWSPRDRALLRAADELVDDRFVTDSTWAELSDLGDRGRMDLVFTVAQYTQVSMILNSFGVQLEPGVEVDPDLAS